MAKSQQKESLAWGRALHLSTEEASNFVTQDDGTIRYNLYVISGDNCTCPENVSNRAAFRTELAGLSVEGHAENCKHCKAVLLLGGEPLPEGLDMQMVAAGYQDQARQAVRANVRRAVPNGTVTAVKRAAAIRVTAKQGYSLLVQNNGQQRSAGRWTFAVPSDMTPEQALVVASARFPSDGYVSAIAYVSPEWADRLDPIV